jgi:WD40 repeat protein
MFMVTSVRCSISTATILSGGADALIKRWDMHSTQCTAIFAGHRKAVTSIDAQNAVCVQFSFPFGISDDLEVLASASEDGTVKVWDWRAPDSEVKTLQGHINAIRAVQFNNHHLISLGKDKLLKVCHRSL